jgi:predicted alpha/beta hydrolase family esterase
VPDALRAVEVGPYRPEMPRDGATLLADASFRPDRTRPGVLVCHPADQRHFQQEVAEWWPVPRSLATSGRAVCLACDLGDPDVERGPTSAAQSWGNDYSLVCLSAAYHYLTGTVGARRGPTLLAGTSMGAVVALNWAVRNRALVAGILIACPVLDLGAAARGPLAEGILAAYHVRRPAGLDRLTTYSPMAYAHELAGLPIRIYASRDDPLAANTEQCRAFAKRVGGTTVEVVDLGPAGHWPVSTPVDDALNFATSVMNR